MIYTRFGTPVTLLSQIDNEGFVKLIAHYEDGDKEREYQVFELRADDGFNEIQAASDAIHLCRDCQRPMQADIQPMHNAAPVTIVTCFNRTCTLWGVTLTTELYANLTEQQLTDYRDSVVRLKKSLGVQS